MIKKTYGHNMLFVLLIAIFQSAWATGAAYAADAIKASGSCNTGGCKKAVSYRPPRRGAPSTRVGGGSRGPDASAPSLFVLTPEHTGLTRQAQPNLYWYISKPVSTRFEFALINENDFQTVAEKVLSEVTKKGIHGVSLADLGVTLKPDVPYRWSVAIVTDEENRSSDIFSSGTIKRVSRGELSRAIREEASTEDGAVSLYAEAGLWYEAIDSATRLIKERPGEKRFIEQRVSLLEQVGLVEIAAHERNRLR